MRVFRSLVVLVGLVANASAEVPPTVTVAGYVEAFYSVNFRLPSNRITNLRGVRERTFTLSNVALDVTGERGPVTARLILQFGSTPST